MKKGQAAMEFLTTYGWAILIVVLVIGALFSFGVFSPNVPNICASSYPIQCHDVKMDDSGKIEFTLSSSDILMANLSKVNLLSPLEDSTCNIIIPNEIPIDIKTRLNCELRINPGAVSEGDRFNGNMEVKYIQAEGGSEHLIKLKFSGTIEKSSQQKI